MHLHPAEGGIVQLVRLEFVRGLEAEFLLEQLHASQNLLAYTHLESHGAADRGKNGWVLELLKPIGAYPCLVPKAECRPDAAQTAEALARAPAVLFDTGQETVAVFLCSRRV